MSISIYLFSRIISTTTVSTLRGVLFLSWLPLPPHCFFFHPSPPSLASISLFCCAASTSPFLFLFLLLTQVLSFPSSPPSFLYRSTTYPNSPFPLLLGLFHFATASCHSYSIFLFSFHVPLLSFSVSSLSLLLIFLFFFNADSDL